jgi:hypothetical protein
MCRAWCCVLLCWFLQQNTALARSRALNDIDTYCKLVLNETSGVTPFVFSGPDPWTELDDAPSGMRDQALAYVYTQGPAVRWVFLRIVDADEGWAEDIRYYFREDGSIAKRVRKVESLSSNIEFEATTYYRSGDILKEVTHHHALRHGHKDSSLFSDPDAPIYMSVDDLPFPDIPDLWRRLV